MLHLTTDVPKPADYSNQSTTKHFYPTSSTYFVLPQTAQYDPASASLAHSRTLVFLRKKLGGPFFDLEAIWDEHTYFEFEARSVAKTMGTMVVRLFIDLVFTALKSYITQAEPYVNHIPTVRLMLSTSTSDQLIYVMYFLDDGRHRSRKTHCFLQGSLHLLVRRSNLFITHPKVSIILSVSNPADTTMQPVSRTVGADRIVGR
jgi:hypothetical protein